MSSKYAVRRVGWAYDDSHYNYDGLFEVEGIYDTRGEAETVCAILSCWTFVQDLHNFSRYDTHRASWSEYEEIQKPLLDYLVYELGFSPTIYIDLPRRGWNPAMFPVRPSEEQLLHLLKLFGIDLYKVVELTHGEQSFLKAYIGETWNRFKSEHPYYLMDDNYEQTMVFSSRKEAFSHLLVAYFRLEEILSVFRERCKQSLNSISDTPDLLRSYLKQHPALLEKPENAWSMPAAITGDVLMGLSALLQEPLLIMEPVEPVYLKQEEVIALEKQSDFYWRDSGLWDQPWIPAQHTVRSDAYLNEFVIDALRSYYVKIDDVHRLLAPHLSARRFDNDWGLYYKNVSFTISALVLTIDQIGDRYRLNAVFALGWLVYSSEMSTTVGEGDSIQTAYSRALMNWLEAQAPLLGARMDRLAAEAGRK